MKLGQELVVVGLTYPIVKEIHARDEFDGRPDNFFLRLRTMGTRYEGTFNFITLSRYCNLQSFDIFSRVNFSFVDLASHAPMVNCGMNNVVLLFDI
jgi:hypothetical protein